MLFADVEGSDELARDISAIVAPIVPLEDQNRLSRNMSNTVREIVSVRRTIGKGEYV